MRLKRERACRSRTLLPRRRLLPLDDRLLPIYDEQFDPDEWANVEEEDVDALLSPSFNEGAVSEDGKGDPMSAFRGVDESSALFRPFAESPRLEISPPGKAALFDDGEEGDDILLDPSQDDLIADEAPKTYEWIFSENIVESDDENDAANKHEKPVMAGASPGSSGRRDGFSERKRERHRPFNLKKERSRSNLPSRPGFHTRVIQLDRVVKVTKSKKVNTIRALVVVGNRQGTAGYGLGRGANAIEALKRARRIALKNTASLMMAEGAALDHNVVGLKNNTYVYFQSLPPGDGLRADGIPRIIAEAFGIRHVRAFQKGRRNRISAVQAAFKGLAKHTPEWKQALEEGRQVRTRRTLGKHEHFASAPKPKRSAASSR